VAGILCGKRDSQAPAICPIITIFETSERKFNLELKAFAFDID
jgi:hypothetical protein